jgi:hypothetical protein
MYNRLRRRPLPTTLNRLIVRQRLRQLNSLPGICRISLIRCCIKLLFAVG